MSARYRLFSVFVALLPACSGTPREGSADAAVEPGGDGESAENPGSGGGGQNSNGGGGQGSNGGGGQGSNGGGGQGSNSGGGSNAGGGDGSDGSGTNGPQRPSVPQTGEINCRHDGDGKTTLVFVNRCSEPVTFAGSDIEGGTLAPGEFVCVDVGNDKDPIESVRYWGWVGKDPGPERHTLAEFTFNTDFYDFDWYNISHVDAHNLPMAITPVDRSNCDTVSCPQDFLAECPEVGRLLDDDGNIVSCVSPDRDNPDSIVARYFEACDDAYAWSGDDQHGDDPSPMHACAGEDWDIVFCPPD